ncbi:MAG: response regulator [Planctomycetota bacterium]|nr:MAG: response regulator [Planctomycetota bacterium]
MTLARGIVEAAPVRRQSSAARRRPERAKLRRTRLMKEGALSSDESSAPSRVHAMSYLLIVEPSKLMAGMIADAMKASRERARIISEAPLALSMVAAEKPLAVVTALELRGIGGESLIAALKIDSRFRAVPIVLLTSRTEPRRWPPPIAPDCTVEKSAGGVKKLVEFLSQVGVMAAMRRGASSGVASEHIAGRILLAEDARAIQKLVRHMLHVAGADVVAVDDGAQAVAAAREGGFDLILMDIEMPVMDGWTATAELRRAGVDAPIVAFSAHDTPEFRAQVTERGFTDLLAKPIKRESLIEACARLLRGAQAAHPV